MTKDFLRTLLQQLLPTERPLGKTLDALVRMEIFVTDIPPICVAKEEGVYFTRNNRRLWVYKQLSTMDRCSIIPCLTAKRVPKEQLTTVIGGHEIIIRGEHNRETLAEFKVKRRTEMLKRIRSRQITRDAQEWAYEPRFEHMIDQ